MRAVVRLRVSPLIGLLIGTVMVGLVSLAAVPYDDSSSGVVPALLLVVPVAVTAVVSSRLVAVVVALEAALVLATAFLPPIGSPQVELGEDAVGLAVFVGVA